MRTIAQDRPRLPKRPWHWGSQLDSNTAAPYRRTMDARKTTFYLPEHLRCRLKLLAAQRGKTVTELLTEGAELVLARDQSALDREELTRRASLARPRALASLSRSRISSANGSTPGRSCWPRSSPPVARRRSRSSGS